MLWTIIAIIMALALVPALFMLGLAILAGFVSALFGGEQ